LAGSRGRRPPPPGGSDDSLLPWGDEADSTLPTQRPAAAPRSGRLMDDDRPTEIFQPAVKQESLHTTREQLITGSTILEMIRNPSHQLSRPLEELVARAQSDLPTAEVDPKATLLLRHDFEFERRVGYRLRLKLFAPDNRCVEVNAEVDADGRAIRRGSMMSKLITI
jgi:hypothetical protein